MNKKRSLAIAACCVLGVGAIGLGVHRYQVGAARAEATKKADNLNSAKKCITSHSPLSQKANAAFRDCELVKPDLLPEEIKPDFTQALAKNEAFKVVQLKRQAEQAKNAAKAKAAAEAKFKAEGWWEQKPGIFVRWCSKGPYCPGKRSYQDYSWRAMVWCKERACGNIYAKLNIIQNDIVVGWTNETAYGGYGQKVVLTFGSSTRGSGRLVEFKTY
jgi:hypothetical protein